MTRAIAVAKKKKKSMTIDANLDAELRRQAEQNVALQFGINGTNFTGLSVANLTGAEEQKESVVGRRDIFRLPNETAAAAPGRGRGGPQR